MAPSALCAKQADTVLDRLLSEVLRARGGMAAELRVRPVDGHQQLLARSRLLAALESYSSALAARGLSAPPLLRDEIALQRNLA